MSVDQAFWRQENGLFRFWFRNLVKRIFGWTAKSETECLFIWFNTRSVFIGTVFSGSLWFLSFENWNIRAWLMLISLGLVFSSEERSDEKAHKIRGADGYPPY